MENAKQTNNTVAPLEVILVSDIEPKEIEWLWYPFIPYGKMTMVRGDPRRWEKHFYAVHRRPAHEGRTSALHEYGEAA